MGLFDEEMLDLKLELDAMGDAQLLLNRLAVNETTLYSEHEMRLMQRRAQSYQVPLLSPP